MASTIGFGEIPYAFSPAQRLWTIVSIYISVIAWLYAIGTILSLLQDSAFRLAATEVAFTRSVRRIREPFYLVCGYGDTGGLLVRSLAERGLMSVVIDINPERIDALRLKELGLYVPGLAADAGITRHLTEAGLLHPRCAGVLALTDRDHVNLQIAITSKLLNPKLPVICRAETQDAASNMASFGTDYIVNPFDAFGERLAMALHSPDLHVLHEWLTGVPRTALAPLIYPPHGTWVLCGYGRFGKALQRYMVREGVSTVIVEADPEKTGCGDCVLGRGTEADTLQEAGIEGAVGIVAGTDDDANNLSILMTARELNPNLFCVGRQNKRANDAIFAAAHAELVMQRSRIIAREIFALITNPLLSRFLQLSREQSRDWVHALVTRLGEVTESEVPDIWSDVISEEKAPAVVQAIGEGDKVLLGHLLCHPRERDRTLPCLPLLLRRGGEDILLPPTDLPVEAGDKLLLCGRWNVDLALEWTLQNQNALSYIMTGEERPAGYFWRWLSERRPRP
jgi:voltage-gated potassium channel Kch